MNISKFKLSNWYYALVLLGYIMTLFIPSFRTGLFASALMVIILTGLGLSVIKSDNKSGFISLINIIVLIYFVYNLFSFIWILVNHYPISIFVGEFSNSILPMVFYGVAIIAYSEKERFYSLFLYTICAFGLLSTILHITQPKFYYEYLYNFSWISKADASTGRVRMESFTGSTSLSFLGVAAMIIAAYFVFKYISVISDKKSENQKLKDIVNNYKEDCIKMLIFVVLFVFSLIIVFLANGRAGMVAAILVVCAVNWLVFFTFNLIDRKYFYIEIGAVLALILIMFLVTPGIAHKFGARLVSLPGAFGQRSEQWISAINNMFGQWFGNGLGANGHKALGIEGAKVVADGGLVKLYCEEGALGFSIFTYIMIRLFVAGVKNLKEYFAELLILTMALLMSIGSNIIAFQLCMPIFWYAAGVISMSVKDRKKLEDNA